eukprot:53449-Eustigmatos_ZCMA.PRE.1
MPRFEAGRQLIALPLIGPNRLFASFYLRVECVGLHTWARLSLTNETSDRERLCSRKRWKP